MLTLVGAYERPVIISPTSLTNARTHLSGGVAIAVTNMSTWHARPATHSSDAITSTCVITAWSSSGYGVIIIS